MAEAAALALGPAGAATACWSRRFPRGGKEFLVAYCFEGRNAHQTLGMLLTRRMERMGLRPLGFVATDYVLGVWSLAARSDATWTRCSTRTCWATIWRTGWTNSSLLKRTFRNVAVIAGLIERRHPGAGEDRHARSPSTPT